MTTPRSSARPASRLALLGIVLLSAACASGGSGATAGAGGTASTPAGSRGARASANVLLREDIEKANFPNLFDLVSALRPRWVQKRGVDSFQQPTEIQVYVANSRMTNGLAALREITAMGVTRIEFFDGITASGRWGLDHGAGAIVVSMQPQTGRP